MSLAETAITLFKEFPFTPGLGLGIMLHVVPFQCSMSVCCPTLLLPTAQTLLAETAATPSRSLNCDVLLGLGMMLHEEPFQCSVNVSKLLLLVTYCPTAQTLLVESAATPLRKWDVP